MLVTVPSKSMVWTCDACGAYTELAGDEFSMYPAPKGWVQFRFSDGTVLTDDHKDTCGPVCAATLLRAVELEKSRT